MQVRLHWLLELTAYVNAYCATVTSKTKRLIWHRLTSKSVNFTDVESLFSFDDSFSPVMMLIWILPIVFFVFYGQQIQLYISANQIKKHILKLETFQRESKDDLIKYIEDSLGEYPNLNSRITMFVDYFGIMPTNMDPGGIVPKVRHLVRSKEEHTRAQIQSLDPKLDEMEQTKIHMLLELASTLRLIYRIINHLYLTAKKQKNFPMILPLQMMLPTIMEEAKALREAGEAFQLGQPIGDGIGSMVVGKMMLDLEKNDVAFRTVWAKTVLHKRTIHLLKPKGPLSTVGRLDDAMETILSKHKIDAIIMIDAALKMEGEEPATITRGFGAAIGGIGTERFKIEEIATKYGIPIHAIVVKQSIKQAVTLMTKAIALTSDAVKDQVFEMTTEIAPEGGSILVVGVGNTMGVSQ